MFGGSENVLRECRQKNLLPELNFSSRTHKFSAFTACNPSDILTLGDKARMSPSEREKKEGIFSSDSSLHVAHSKREQG